MNDNLVKVEILKCAVELFVGTRGKKPFDPERESDDFKKVLDFIISTYIEIKTGKAGTF